MTATAAETLIRTADLAVEGQLVTASNTTLRCTVADSDLRAVYKPIRGERPLWDFPDGTLAGREVASHDLAVAAGWDVVPTTVLRDGPLGTGMVQLWIDEAPDAEPTVDLLPTGADLAGWRVVLEAVDADDRPVLLVHTDEPALRRVALFDAVVNNADRKASHLLRPAGQPARLLGVDHGLTFHTEAKLRTALWGWAGEPLTSVEIGELTALREALAGPLGDALLTLITPVEVEATLTRVDVLLAEQALPLPPVDRTPIPWPVF